MNKIVKTLIFILFLGGFTTLTFAKTWQEYVKVNVTGRQHGYGYANEQKSLFKQQFASWEKNKEREEKAYEELGFTKSLASHFVKERIQWAKEVIDSDFDDEIEVPQAVQFVENRTRLMTHISELEHGRFKELVKKYDFKVSSDFYSCLCHSSGAGGAGGGVRYIGGKCIATGVLGGTWEVTFPTDPKKWANCSRKNPMTDGGDIFREISKNSNISRKGDTANERLVDLIKNRNENFEKLCLPSLTKNVTDNILKPDDLTKSSILKKAFDISSNSENICEEAVAMGLFLNSQQGRNTGDIAIEAMIPWIPGKIGIASQLLQKDPVGLLEELVGSPPILSTVNNLKSNAKLLEEVLKQQQINSHYDETYKLFVESKDWSSEKLASTTTKMASEIADLEKKIDDVDREFINKLQGIQPTIKEIDVYGKRYWGPANNISNDATFWKNYTVKENALIRERNANKGGLVLQHTKLLMKNNILNNYRAPFSKDKGCEEYLRKIEGACR